MTTVQEESNCQQDQKDDQNDVSCMEVDTPLRFPLDGSVNVVFTGHYNGVGVEVRPDEALGVLYHMGCFGKGSASRSRPIAAENDQLPILRRRQYLKRSQWFNKYTQRHFLSEADLFMREVEELTSDIMKDARSRSKKDVIDLVSSDESNSDSDDMSERTMTSLNNKDNIVVVVPNSESEDDNYFANLKPKCCLNKTKLEEKLMLTAQEAFFLMYGLGCLQVVNGDHALSIEDSWKLFSDNDRNFVEKYVVYHYFRSKGYIMKPGIKFGGDYLLYKDGPEVDHAEYIVVIRFNDNCFDWTSIHGHVRVSNTTSKKILITEVIKSDKLHLQLPQDLSEYSVREILLNRNIPVTINDDID
ncbi:uncharacterized protein Tsen2 [Epargyreus clarus]|uniref:uncharacterized protein Tsen2 n=1 Tax=Epargyreus clarus TaxID=520877 RepID=UPI003C2BE206